MVLEFRKILCFGVLLIGIAACSSTQKQSVVAVSASSSGGQSLGRMSTASVKSQTTPTPKAVLDLLAKAEDEYEAENWLQATRLLDRAQRMASDEPRVYLGYGELYLKQGKRQKAQAMFQRVLSLAGGDSRIARQAKSYLNSM